MEKRYTPNKVYMIMMEENIYIENKEIYLFNILFFKVIHIYAYI